MDPAGQMESRAYADSAEKRPVRRRRLPASFGVSTAPRGSGEERSDGSDIPCDDGGDIGRGAETPGDVRPEVFVEDDEEELPIVPPGFIPPSARHVSLRRDGAYHTKYDDSVAWRGTPFCLECAEQPREPGQKRATCEACRIFGLARVEPSGAGSGVRVVPSC